MRADLRSGVGWMLVALVVLVPLGFFWQSRQRGGRRAYAPMPGGGLVSLFSPAGRSASLARAASGAKLADSSTTPDMGGAFAPASPVSPAAGRDLEGASSDSNPLVENLPGYSSQNDRDPTMSPLDLKRLADLSLPRPQKAPPPPKPIALEDRIRLSGIIVAGRSINAIVNNERVRKNDDVLGAKIVRITATCVEFRYHKRNFEKCIQ